MPAVLTSRLLWYNVSLPSIQKLVTAPFPPETNALKVILSFGQRDALSGRFAIASVHAQSGAGMVTSVVQRPKPLEAVNCRLVLSVRPSMRYLLPPSDVRVPCVLVRVAAVVITTACQLWRSEVQSAEEI